MVNGHSLEVGDVVRNRFVPALIGVVTVSRPDGVIMVKVGEKEPVMDVGWCWEVIKPIDGNKELSE